MSVIGPRPLTPETFNFYTDDVKDNITKIKPGLSGMVQLFLDRKKT